MSASLDSPASEATSSTGNGKGAIAGDEAPPSSPPLFSPALLRRLAASNSIMDVAEALSVEASLGLHEDDARSVLGFFLQCGKVQLALAMYREMCMARRVGGGGRVTASRSLDVAYAWPAASLTTTRHLVLGLCQQLCTVEALQVRLLWVQVAGCWSCDGAVRQLVTGFNR